MTSREHIRFVPLLALGAATALAACVRPPEPAAPSSSVRVRSFSESAPVRALVAAPPYLFAATEHGLTRWNLADDTAVELGDALDLRGERVLAMTMDPARRWLWLATEAGLARYDLASGAVERAPRSVPTLETSAIALAPAADGVWIGGRDGLRAVDLDSDSRPPELTEPVTALRRDAQGWLWIGTKGGLWARRPDGTIASVGGERGCELARVRFFAPAPDGAMLAIGNTATGAQRVVRVAAGACELFRPSPEVEWLAAAPQKDSLLVLTRSRLYRLRLPSQGARRLRRDPMRLVPVASGGGGETFDSPYSVELVSRRLPAAASSVAASADAIFLGTRDIGVARLASSAPATDWLRRADLVGGSGGLTVACTRATDCYVATGARRAWRFDGRRFHSTGPADRDVLAFVRDSTGRVYALHRATGGSKIELSRVLAGVWTSVPDLAIDTPGREPTLTFARFSPSDVLWLGVRYRDRVGEVRPHGVALVDIGLGAVVYHHASRSRQAVQQGVLPIPINVQDACFIEDDEVWLATSEGAARVRGEDVRVFTEAEAGLRSELLRGIACSAGGMVYVASGQGVGRFDGEAWHYPRALEWPVNDLEFGLDGRLWMATDRGVAVFDGARLRRLDRRRGLLEDQVRNVAVDHLGRVWARTRAGLTLIAP